MYSIKVKFFGLFFEMLLIGKKSFSLEKLEENYKNFIDAIIKAKPKGAKGTYLKGIFISFTMGPSLKIINK